MYIPASTYRIQFNKDFTFKNLLEQLQYLSSIGIGAVYASPVFAAVPGSNHGYDVTNPLVFNKEIGSNKDFEEIIDFLKSKNIGWIQDIVPNHMAFHPDNHWLMDILEKGKLSAYAEYFDIDWNHPDFQGKVMVPILGKSLKQAVDDGEIKLSWENGGMFISYYDFKIPLSGESFHELIEENKVLEGSYFSDQGIAKGDYESGPAFKGSERANSRERLQTIYETSNSFETYIENICGEVNSDNDKLLELLNNQHFVLSFWQDVENYLNYRRFFTINGLISLCMEKKQVFEDYHSFIYEMVKSGKFQGLRIDHVDGLKNPNIYFERLRAKMGDDTYIVVEKILEHDEELEKEWPLQGSSGYDFLALVNNIFTNRSGISSLFGFYNQFSENLLQPEEIIYNKKKMILNQSFRGDWDNICRLLEKSNLVDFNDTITPDSMREAIGEFLINSPVYKLYSNKLPIDSEDISKVRQIIEKSIQKTPHLTSSLKKLENIFLNENLPEDQKDFALELFLRCMQYTGPLMAKGVEDTAMYSWSAFIAHNEVGDAIDANGITIEDFHKHMIDRKAHYPMSINATATHDTKRGEDSRARLNVISDFASEWIQLVKQWQNKSMTLKVNINNNLTPDFNEEYFIYQTLAGVYPMDGKPDSTLTERVSNYLQKALREAKVHSNWNQPDTSYENAVIDFPRKLLEQESSIKKQMESFIKKISEWGIVNSLSQVVLKCTCPGIPDFYQGTELWDLSLVDPDNRRAVNYPQREMWLNDLRSIYREQKDEFLISLLKNKEDGKIKLWITHRLMLERAANHEFFINADYLPLEVKGSYKEHILAFARTSGYLWYITVIPLHPALLPQSKNKKVIDWEDTTIELPQFAPKDWQILWDDTTLKAEDEISISKILTFDCPVVLKSTIQNTGRGSGILMHISSLPGKYGTGDFGDAAYKFVDFLNQCGQSYWQILPFNPIGGSYSPYSSSSAFAGNTTFINLESLYKKRLLNQLPEHIPESNSADFDQAQKLRKIFIDKAFVAYLNQDSPLLQKRFVNFCESEKYWLDDFALYSVFKSEFEDKPWNEWPHKIKTRDEKELTSYTEKYSKDLTRIKFGQFLFYRQFKELKAYANSKGIEIIGDMPIYVSYDSSDVWANPQLFNLDKQLRMETVAGVPPDYFSETGQLWNMPIYNWETMKTDKYDWWKKRIRKNLEYCDMLRFDHFRGFSSYWEVPAGESTAINGKWIQGPANDFFNELKAEFPRLPFIAEDLGEIDDAVYKLRDDFALPGMKVLQFAFGENMPLSVHIPHMHTVNSIVYTGTHDNNTTKGWYRTGAEKSSKKQLNSYLNRKINSSTITGEFLRLAFASVSRIAITPIQDILNLDETARLNNPGKAEGNWTWKLKQADLKPEHTQYLKLLSRLYGR